MLTIFRKNSQNSLKINIGQHTARHSNTLQHAEAHCNTLTVFPKMCSASLFKQSNTLHHIATHCCTLQHTGIHCNTLQHTATHWRYFWTCIEKPYNIRHHTATICSTLQHITAHATALQHTATHLGYFQRCIRKVSSYRRDGWWAQKESHCSILENTATHCTIHNAPLKMYQKSSTTQYKGKCLGLKKRANCQYAHHFPAATHCNNTLQHTATPLNMHQHHFTLQHDAPHCNTLQHVIPTLNMH